MKLTLTMNEDDYLSQSKTKSNDLSPNNSSSSNNSSPLPTVFVTPMLSEQPNSIIATNILAYLDQPKTNETTISHNNDRPKLNKNKVTDSLVLSDSDYMDDFNNDGDLEFVDSDEYNDNIGSDSVCSSKAITDETLTFNDLDEDDEDDEEDSYNSDVDDIIDIVGDNNHINPHDDGSDGDNEAESISSPSVSPEAYRRKYKLEKRRSTSLTDLINDIQDRNEDQMENIEQNIHHEIEKKWQIKLNQQKLNADLQIISLQKKLLELKQQITQTKNSYHTHIYPPKTLKINARRLSTISTASSVLSPLSELNYHKFSISSPPSSYKKIHQSPYGGLPYYANTAPTIEDLSSNDFPDITLGGLPDDDIEGTGYDDDDSSNNSDKISPKIKNNTKHKKKKRVIKNKKYCNYIAEQQCIERKKKLKKKSFLFSWFSCSPSLCGCVYNPTQAMTASQRSNMDNKLKLESIPSVSDTSS